MTILSFHMAETLYKPLYYVLCTQIYTSALQTKPAGQDFDGADYVGMGDTYWKPDSEETFYYICT